MKIAVAVTGYVGLSQATLVRKTKYIQETYFQEIKNKQS